MPAKKKDVPQFFRLNVEVGDLDKAIHFYSTLLGVDGRKQPGSRVYYECGPVTLQVVDVSSVRKPHIAAKALYFTVKDLESIFSRATSLGSLSRESVHDAPGGGIVVRAWGERSFYVGKICGKIPCASLRKERFIQVDRSSLPRTGEKLLQQHST